MHVCVVTLGRISTIFVYFYLYTYLVFEETNKPYKSRHKPSYKPLETHNSLCNIYVNVIQSNNKGNKSYKNEKKFR